jgi:hypothetical protein
MGSRLRTIGRLAAVGALALLLSACLKLDMSLEVSSDDTVSGSVIFAVQKELLDLAGGSVEDLLGTDAPLPEGVEGVSVEDYEDSEFAGQRYTLDAVPLEQFNSGDGEEQLRIAREGDVFTVSGVLDLSSGLTGPTGLTGIDPSQFLQGADLRISISFPGDVTDANGQVDGNTVTWRPEIGERLELHATASAVGGGDSNLTTILIIAGIAVVVIAIVVAVVLSQRRGRPAVAVAGGGDAGTAGSGEPSMAPGARPPAPPGEPEEPPPPAGPTAVPPSAPPPPPPPEPGPTSEPTDPR